MLLALGQDGQYSIESGRATYDAGHIPGAGFLDIAGDLSYPGQALRFMLPSADQFADAMGKAGVGSDTRVILYSTNMPAWATRLWWMLRAFGFDNVAVLDGGLPRWAAEGLAMLFEAPGVWDTRHYPHQRDRINRSRLKRFRQYAQHRKAGSLPLFVSQTNRGFAQNPGASYAEAWALSFFLSEKEPAKYMKYLAKTAAREPLKTYSSAERWVS